jgi:CRP-like cAMP-binding protein
MADQLRLKFVNFSKGAYIIIEGTHDTNHFFIIRSGKVGISKEIEVVKEERNNVLGPGDFFGVISTMSAQSHIETATALTDVSLISVQKDQYPQLIQRNAPVAMKIILQFSKRMRYLDEALAALTSKNNIEGSDSQLFNIGEYYAKKSQYYQAVYAYTQYIKHNPKGANVNTARMRIMKIAPYAKGAKLSFSGSDVIRPYTEDSVIFCEGEPGNELFIIQSGSVKITKIVDNKEVLLAVLKAGDIFGEMALLESKPRAASAVAYKNCKVMTVNRANFEQMIAREPQLIARLTTLLAERIWFIYKQIANTLITDPLGRVYDVLLIQLEKNKVPPKFNGSFLFDFGPDELANMVGFSPEESIPVLKKLFENRFFKILDNKIYASNTSEIYRQGGYYKKLLFREGLTNRNKFSY